MTVVQRILDPERVTSLADHVDLGGLRALEAVERLGANDAIVHLEASGLRGRGGGGFPTGTKWRTVAENHAPTVPTTVVVNAAEGEPGSFKDRLLLRRNPYRVLEGAIAAALVVGADRVVVGVKEKFTTELARVRAAAADLTEAGANRDVALEVFPGPDSYLFGEETGLLETIAGRGPFPRVAPPFRHGADELREDGTAAGSAAHVALAGEGDATPAPPTLVNNVETFAHAATILAEGPNWFRSVGTEATPGTVLCTITGATRTHGVIEVASTTTLRAAIDLCGQGAERPLVAALSGTANPLLPEALFDTPLCFGAMDDAGAGLGAAGFVVFDDTDDLAAIAAGVARFLAVESCGQCEPCKRDGIALADLLDRIRRSAGDTQDLESVARRIDTVTGGARCYLAHQQEQVLRSVLELFPDALASHLDGARPGADPVLVAPIADIVDGVARIDDHQRDKQPDWTHGDDWSGTWPAAQREQWVTVE